MARGIKLLRGVILPALLAWHAGAVALECPAPTPPAQVDALPRPVYGNGILFRVGQEGLEDSHILGTVHVSDERITEKVKRAQSLLEHSDRLFLELEMDAQTMQEIALASFYPADQTLAAAVGAELAEASVELLSKHSVPAPLAQKMRPWAAFLTLSMPQNPGIPLDMLLMTQAQELGVDVAGLETAAEQIAALDSLDAAEEIAVLTATVCEYDKNQQLVNRMIEMYLESDLGALANLSQQQVGADLQPIVDKFYRVIVDQRNARMVERLLPKLRDGNQFVAVGALHLVGESGILNQLALRGFRIEKLE